MNIVKATWIVLAMLSAGSASAMEGNFDRSEEVAKYVELFKNGPRGAVTDASKEIYLSGIGDLALATAMKDRMLADYQEIKQSDKIGNDYLAWVTKALASTGVAEHAASLRQVCDGAKSQSTRTHCKDELERIDYGQPKKLHPRRQPACFDVHQLDPRRQFYLQAIRGRAHKLGALAGAARDECYCRAN
jgi:hypothetical protein